MVCSLLLRPAGAAEALSVLPVLPGRPDGTPFLKTSRKTSTDFPISSAGSKSNSASGEWPTPTTRP